MVSSRQNKQLTESTKIDVDSKPERSMERSNFAGSCNLQKQTLICTYIHGIYHLYTHVSSISCIYTLISCISNYTYDIIDTILKNISKHSLHPLPHQVVFFFVENNIDIFGFTSFQSSHCRTQMQQKKARNRPPIRRARPL